MPFILSPIIASDADMLVRNVEYPANQDNPLYRLMFPSSKTAKQKEQLEAEIRWMVEGLTESLSKEDSSLRKACGENGRPVGFVEWVVGKTTVTRDISGKQSIQRKESAGKTQVGEPKKQAKGSSWCPDTLDVATWLDVSDKLRKERERVLQNHDTSNICRKSPLVVIYITCLHKMLRYYHHVSRSNLSASRNRFYASTVRLRQSRSE